MEFPSQATHDPPSAGLTAVVVIAVEDKPAGLLRVAVGRHEHNRFQVLCSFEKTAATRKPPLPALNGPVLLAAVHDNPAVGILPAALVREASVGHLASPVHVLLVVLATVGQPNNSSWIHFENMLLRVPVSHDFAGCAGARSAKWFRNRGEAFAGGA